MAGANPCHFLFLFADAVKYNTFNALFQYTFDSATGIQSQSLVNHVKCALSLVRYTLCQCSARDSIYNLAFEFARLKHTGECESHVTGCGLHFYICAFLLDLCCVVVEFHGCQFNNVHQFAGLFE